MLHMYSTLYTCSALKYILQFMIACPLGSPSSNSKLYCLNCFMNPIQVLHLIKAAMTWYDKAFWMTKRCRVFLRTCYNHVGPFAQLNSWLNCGKNICLCQKALTLKDDIFDWCSDRDKSKKPCWDNELVNRDAAAFSAFCFSNIFRCHSFNRFVNKCLSKHWTQLWFMLIFMDKI